MGKDIHDIEMKDEADFENIIDKNFNYTTNMQQNLVFMKRKHDENYTDKNATIVLEGEIGNGKSTTGNSIMYVHSKEKGI